MTPDDLAYPAWQTALGTLAALLTFVLFLIALRVLFDALALFHHAGLARIHRHHRSTP